MKFELSYTEAMTIQRSQIAFYRQSIGRRGIKKIRSLTKPCPPDIHPDTPQSIFKINDLIPRGSDIEALFRHMPAQQDPTKIAWHEAINRGLF